MIPLQSIYGDEMRDVYGDPSHNKSNDADSGAVAAILGLIIFGWWILALASEKWRNMRSDYYDELTIKEALGYLYFWLDIGLLFIYALLLVITVVLIISAIYFLVTN